MQVFPGEGTLTNILQDHPFATPALGTLWEYQERIGVPTSTQRPNKPADDTLVVVAVQEISTKTFL